MRNETDTLRLAGDLDIYHVEAAREALLAGLTTRPSLELDLSGVETCDAAGLQLLIATQRSAVAAGKSFSLVTPAPAVDQCRELLGLPPQTLTPHTP